MSGQTSIIALGTAIGEGAPIAFNSAGGAADWIMVVPLAQDGALRTVDGRGPYNVGSVEKLISESMQSAGGRLPIDENHSTDLAAPRGEPAPARGWATELQRRDDGIYARVEWSVPGAALMSEKAYRFISPVFIHDKANNVQRLLRASLTNTPNLRGMAALHSQETTSMDLLAKLRELFGLPADADEAAVIAAIKASKDKGGDTDKALQSVLAPIAKAAGLKEDSTVTAIATAVTSLASTHSAAESEVVKSLQSEVAGLAGRINELTSTGAKDRATAYVDGEIKRGRVGVKAMRDTYISMHAASADGAANVEKIVGAMPILGPSGAMQTPPDNKDGNISLNSEQQATARMLGVSDEDYAKTLASEAT